MDAPDSNPTIDERPVDRCTHCGYSLVGSVERRCPECGTTIATTRLLRAADPQWLRLVVVGERLIRNGALVAIVVFFGGQWIVSALASFGIVLGPPKLVVRGILGASLAAALVGAWFAATPDPAEIDERERLPWLQRRSVLRGSLVAVGALLVLRFGLDAYLPPLVGPVLTITALALGLTALRGVGGVVRRLLERCADVSPPTRRTPAKAARGSSGSSSRSRS